MATEMDRIVSFLKEIDKKILSRLNENILELKNLDYRNNVKLFFCRSF